MKISSSSAETSRNNQFSPRSRPILPHSSASQPQLPRGPTEAPHEDAPARTLLQSGPQQSRVEQGGAGQW